MLRYSARSLAPRPRPEDIQAVAVSGKKALLPKHVSLEEPFISPSVPRCPCLSPLSALSTLLSLPSLSILSRLQCCLSSRCHRHSCPLLMHVFRSRRKSQPFCRPSLLHPILCPLIGRLSRHCSTPSFLPLVPLSRPPSCQSARSYPHPVMNIRSWLCVSRYLVSLRRAPPPRWSFPGGHVEQHPFPSGGFYESVGSGSDSRMAWR